MKALVDGEAFFTTRGTSDANETRIYPGSQQPGAHVLLDDLRIADRGHSRGASRPTGGVIAPSF
jgi:hypothetical protein